MPDVKADTVDRLLVVLVVAAALALASVMFAGYWTHPDLLWRSYYHDRNGHYAFALDLALDLRALNPIAFFTDLLRSMVWPPLHGLLLAAILVIAGPDYRFGVLPSLGGWVMTVVFVWLIARRMFVARDQSRFAAAVAVLLTAASPVFRLISTDVMLEGLGAGLSALSLWAYLRAQSEPERIGRWRLLALSLTALFFEKGNYWGLVAFALAATFASENFTFVADRVRSVMRTIDRGTALKAALRDPLLIVSAFISLIVAYLYWRGPTAVMLAGRAVKLYPPENLVTVAYAVLFARAGIAWLHHRAAFDAWLGMPGRTLYYWHVTPILVYFLLPRHLASFLWFIGPLNNNRTVAFDPLGGLTLYWHAFARGFHLAPWMAVLSIFLAFIGATQIRRLPAGARAVFFLAAVGWAAVVLHPQHQGRFLTSWIFSVWICAGIGAAALLVVLRINRTPMLRPLVATAAVFMLAAASLWYRPSAAAYAAAIHPSKGPTDLDFVRPYLQDLNGAKRVEVATTFGNSQLFSWAIREHCRCDIVVHMPWISNLPTRDAVRRAMAAQIAVSRADRVVVIDAPGSPYSQPKLGWVYDRMAGIVDAMKNQHRYALIATYPIPSEGAVATIWRLRGGRS